MKKVIFIIAFLLAINYSNVSFATDEDNTTEVDTNEIIEEQEETFGISSFISQSQEYTSDTFEDIDLSSLYKNALSGNIDTDEMLSRSF